MYIVDPSSYSNRRVKHKQVSKKMKIRTQYLIFCFIKQHDLNAQNKLEASSLCICYSWYLVNDMHGIATGMGCGTQSLDSETIICGALTA